MTTVEPFVVVRACWPCDIRSTELACFNCGGPMGKIPPLHRTGYSEHFIALSMARCLAANVRAQSSNG